ncbi:MAG: Fic family protein [Myxococcota bacterium]|nr:Fic family protein [Myxococcota bacterium]
MKSQHSELIRIVSQFPNGTNIDTLLDALKPTVSKRTLQRRLQQLVLDRELVKVGKGRTTTYKVASLRTKPNVPTADTMVPRYDEFIPLSEESLEIISYVRQPLSARKPVAFSRDLVDAYVPGQTWYLNQVSRMNLKRIGEPGFENRPAGTYGRAILDRILIDLSWASSRLEGNTYTRLDTQRLIELGHLAEGRDAMEAQMILNHKRAIELLVDDAAQIGFNRYTFCNLHGVLSENLMSDPAASGTLRTREVEIGQSVYQPTNVPQVISEIFNTILNKAESIPDPFEQALFAMVHIPYLQPFEDVNKRVARIGANIPLIKQNLCPLTFLDLPERALIDAVLGVYEMSRIELLRDVFIWAYERSTQQYIKVKKSLTEPDPMRLKYRSQIHGIVGEVVRGLRLHARQAVIAYAEENIPGKDQNLFIELVLDDLKRLHEGVIARYRIRPSELRAWQDTLKKNLG